ncbi:hypothetical protein [Staphylococcus borealis]|uniref:hypothetical protein n=1 Tax=Staphylococcus borealis TaxID=2742203 RepID=UPI00265BC8E1|nr:hypothetical protein [Staphylococcus borealis]MDO0995402.1 hypothetical protein [Staphylococcus borealis]
MIYLGGDMLSIGQQMRREWEKQELQQPKVQSPIYHRYQITDTLAERESFTSVADNI